MGDYGRGGGSIAMYRLHRDLRAAGVDSKILCKYKKLESSESVTIPHSFLSARLEPRLGQLTSLFGLNDIHLSLSRFAAGADAGFLGRHEDRHLREHEGQETQILQQPAPGG